MHHGRDSKEAENDGWRELFNFTLFTWTAIDTGDICKQPDLNWPCAGGTFTGHCSTTLNGEKKGCWGYHETF